MNKNRNLQIRGSYERTNAPQQHQNYISNHPQTTSHRQKPLEQFGGSRSNAALSGLGKFEKSNLIANNQTNNPRTFSQHGRRQHHLINASSQQPASESYHHSVQLNQTENLPNIHKKKGITNAIDKLNTELGKTFTTVHNIENYKSAQFRGKDTMDTTQMLNNTNSQFKTLLARLNRIVTSGDALHTQIYDKLPNQDFEIFDDLNLHLKLQLKGRNPPCTIRFRYKPYMDMKVYTSTENKRPSEHSHQNVYHKADVIHLSGSKVSGNHVFKEEWLYMTISSTQGCKFNVTVSFKPTPTKRKQANDNGFDERIKQVTQMPAENEEFDFGKFNLSSTNQKERQAMREGFINQLQQDKKSYMKFKETVKQAKIRKMQRGVNPEMNGRKPVTTKSQNNRVVQEFYQNSTYQEQYDFIYRNTYIMPLYKEYSEQQQYFKQMLKVQKTQSVRQRRTQHEEEKQAERIFWLQKWDHFRKASQQLTELKIKIKEGQDRAIRWIAYTLLHQRIKALEANLKQKRSDRQLKFIMNISQNRVARLLKKHLMKKGCYEELTYNADEHGAEFTSNHEDNYSDHMNHDQFNNGLDSIKKLVYQPEVVIQQRSRYCVTFHSIQLDQPAKKDARDYLLKFFQHYTKIQQFQLNTQKTLKLLVKVQRKWKDIKNVQQQRENIIENCWKRRGPDLIKNQKGSQKGKNQQHTQEIMAIQSVHEDVRKAIIKKWLNYLYFERVFATKRWYDRKKALNLTKEQELELKVQLRIYRAEADRKKKKYLENDTVSASKDANRYGQRVHRIFPLLDPALDETTRLAKHQEWLQQGESFITGVDLELSDLASAAPLQQDFMPAPEILRKLLYRSIQIKNIEEDLKF